MSVVTEIIIPFFNNVTTKCFAYFFNQKAENTKLRREKYTKLIELVYETQGRIYGLINYVTIPNYPKGKIDDIKEILQEIECSEEEIIEILKDDNPNFRMFEKAKKFNLNKAVKAFDLFNKFGLKSKLFFSIEVTEIENKLYKKLNGLLIHYKKSVNLSNYYYNVSQECELFKKDISELIIQLEKTIRKELLIK